MNKWNESEHPRDGDGMFTDKNVMSGQRQQTTKGTSDAYVGDDEEYRQNDKRNYKKLLTKGASQGNIHSCPKTNGFRSDRDAEKHYNSHSREFIGLSKKEYIASAINFVNNVEGAVYFLENESRYYKFNRNTTEFAVIGVDKNLISYYKARYKKGIQKEEAQKYIERIVKDRGGVKL